MIQIKRLYFVILFSIAVCLIKLICVIENLFTTTKIFELQEIS